MLRFCTVASQQECYRFESWSGEKRKMFLEPVLPPNGPNGKTIMAKKKKILSFLDLIIHT